MHLLICDFFHVLVHEMTNDGSLIDFKNHTSYRYTLHLLDKFLYHLGSTVDFSNTFRTKRCSSYIF